MVPIIVTAFLELWVILQQETLGQAIRFPIVIHTTDEISCPYENSDERILAAQWYKSSDSDGFVKDGGAVAWWYNGDTGGLHGKSMKDDFALVMRNVNITDRGLYRCVVTLSGNVEDYTHDVNIEVYALPSGPPLIEYARQANESRIICSVNNIYPMASPELKLLNGRKESEVQDDNEDGTFNITTIKYIPCSEDDLDAECSYSNLNYDNTSSLRIPSCFSVSSGESDELPTVVPCTDSNNRDLPRGRWIGWTTLILEGFQFIALMAIVIGEKTGPSIKQACGLPAKKKRAPVSFLGKHHYAALMGIVHIIIFFLAIAYMAATGK